MKRGVEFLPDEEGYSNSWISYDLFIKDWTAGEEHAVPEACQAADGQVIDQYSSSKDGHFVSNVPEDPRQYYIRAAVPVHGLYKVLEGEPVSFRILNRGSD